MQNVNPNNDVTLRRQAPAPTSASDRSSVLDLDILDLDAVLVDDTSECWLTSNNNTTSSCTTSTHGTNDQQTEEELISWLHRASEGLDPRKRHSLALKLEAITRKNPPSLMARKSSSTSTVDDVFYDAHDEWEEEAMRGQLLGARIAAKESKNRLLPSARSSTSRIGHEVSTPDFVTAEDQIAANMSGMSLSQYYKPQPTTTQLTVDIKSARKPIDPIVGCPPSHPQPSIVQISPRITTADISTNLHDIEALASLQQEELRQYMERLKADRAAKRQSLGQTAALPNVVMHRPSTTSDNVAALLSPNRPTTMETKSSPRPRITHHPPTISTTPQPRLPPNTANTRFANSIANNPGRQRSDDSLSRTKILRTGQHRVPTSVAAPSRMARDITPKAVNIVRRIPPPSQAAPPPPRRVSPVTLPQSSRLPTPQRMLRRTGIPTPNRHRSPAVPNRPPRPTTTDKWKDECF